MDFLNTPLELFALCGALWSIATAGAFIAGIGEKSFPNEGGKHPAAVAALAGIVSIITPFLLFLHGFWAIAPHAAELTSDIAALALMSLTQAVGIVLLVVMAVLVIVPALLGVLVALVAPPFGKLLYAIAPYLNIAAFALTVYATHDNVLAVINAVMHRPV